MTKLKMKVFCEDVIEGMLRVLAILTVISLSIYFLGSFIFFEFLHIETDFLWFFIRTVISISFVMGVLYGFLKFEDR